MTSEPEYVLRTTPKEDAPKPRRDYKGIAKQTLEVIGILLIAVGASLYAIYLGPIILGIYVVYAANA